MVKAKQEQNKQHSDLVSGLQSLVRSLVRVLISGIGLIEADVLSSGR